MCLCLVQYNNIHAGKYGFMHAEGFSHYALYACSANSLATIFFGYRQPQPGFAALLPATQNGEVFIAAAPGIAEHPAVRFFVQQARGASEAVAAGFSGGPRAVDRGRCS